MKTIIATAFALLSTCGIAAACPNAEIPASVNISGSGHSLTGAGLQYGVMAGGFQSLQNCNWPHIGSVTSPPNFEFLINDLSSYNMLEMVSLGDCDTVLLVLAPDEQFYFDDDSAGNGNPGIYFQSPQSGYFSVWVGTYSPGNCEASLSMRTYN